MYISASMKAMPLLLPRTQTMKIPGNFEAALAINFFALRRQSVNMMFNRYSSGLSGGFMVLRKSSSEGKE